MVDTTRMFKFSAVAGLILACLFLSMPSLSAQSNRASSASLEKPAAVFEGRDTMLRPEGYREWVFVGSSTGLNYMPNPAPASANSDEDIKHVYINPSSYREFIKTGKFPEGTVMILEIAEAARKNEAGLQGSYAEKFIALEASVKDSKRFPGGWAYFGFTDMEGRPLAKAKPFPDNACLSCHREKAATDRVFTQFYPVLNSAR
ncbi:MAG: cytochrome P460 family protein [Blastocatellia bacterium]|nr:cytochrome P460 family protein [Blastocatellia bacterium]